MLNAAPLLAPADVRALAAGLCPAQPCKAQLLLQEALEKRRSCPQAPGGSLVLVLDKVRACPCRFSLSSDVHCVTHAFLSFLFLLFPLQHLQKLPWESMACLRTLPVTRLPSLHFLLSYSLAQRVSGGGGTLALRGAWDPSRLVLAWG